MISIEPLKPSDLPATAALHKQNLSLGLFPKLGRDFLSVYQDGFARSPFGIALVARSDDQVVGALFGTTSNAEHYRWVIRNLGAQLALAGSGALLMRPQLAFSFARTRLGRYTRSIARNLSKTSPQPSPQGGARSLSVLSHIVTSDNARRRGIGRRLVEEFKARARAKGAHRALLVTEEGGLGTPFFEKIGCRLAGSRKGQDGAVLREYKMILDEAGAYEEMGNSGRSSFVVSAYPGRLGSVQPVHAIASPEHR